MISPVMLITFSSFHSPADFTSDLGLVHVSGLLRIASKEINFNPFVATASDSSPHSSLITQSGAHRTDKIN